MKMWIGAAVLHSNSLPGLAKLQQLKDSHPSVACTYKAFSWHSQAGGNRDSPLYFNSRNQAHKPLEWRPGCDSATKQTQALSTYICLLPVFHKLPPHTGLWPNSRCSPQRQAGGSRSWMAPRACRSEMLSMSHSSRPPAPAAQSHPDFCIPPQLSRMARASPGTNKAAQIQCHHSRRAWLPPSPGTLTSPSQPAARACHILCPHFLS